jgi:DNA repair exonuclease SbcCD nuclease subunit
MSHSIKSNKIGIFSDIHIGLGQDSNSWHDIVLNFANWAAKIYTDMGINEIIIPGDIFHNRSEISVNTIAVATEFFDILKDFKIFISTGNHDCYYKDRSDVNSIKVLKGWKNIIIVDEQPLIINSKNKKISLIPWGTSIENIPESDICFGHFEINTFYMNTFKVCDHGIDSTNILNKAPLVISGHFHSKDEREYSKGKIVYVGSPYQQNFGDVNQTRGIYILNLDTEEFKFIENTISPKHIKVYLSKLKNGEQNTDFLKENISNNMISLIVDEEISNDKLSLISAKLQKLNPKFFRIDYKSFTNDKFVENSSLVDYNLINIEKNIEDFVDSMDVNHKNDIKEYLTTLYKELAI